MRSTDIYMHFHGNAWTAFNYYKSVFGGEFVVAQKFKEMPGGDKMHPDDQERYMHISLQISPQTVLLGSDLPSKDSSTLIMGNNIHICMQAESEKEADKAFAALSKGGRIEMPMNKTFWGAYFGMCRDQFGVLWMINYLYPTA